MTPLQAIFHDMRRTTESCGVGLSDARPPRISLKHHSGNRNFATLLLLAWHDINNE
jgi:hypothetical protein